MHSFRKVREKNYAIILQHYSNELYNWINKEKKKVGIYCRYCTHLYNTASGWYCRIRDEIIRNELRYEMSQLFLYLFPSIILFFHKVVGFNNHLIEFGLWVLHANTSKRIFLSIFEIVYSGIVGPRATCRGFNRLMVLVEKNVMIYVYTHPSLGGGRVAFTTGNFFYLFF